MPVAVLALCSLFALQSPPPAEAPSGSPTARTFERDSNGAAKDGQAVVLAPAPRRQIVAIIPDRTTGRDWGLRYLAEAVDDFNRVKPDAVFCVGDLVQGYSRDHEHVGREHADFLEIVGRLEAPFFPTASHHHHDSGKRDTKDRSFAYDYL